MRPWRGGRFELALRALSDLRHQEALSLPFQEWRENLSRGHAASYPERGPGALGSRPDSVAAPSWATRLFSHSSAVSQEGSAGRRALKPLPTAPLPVTGPARPHKGLSIPVTFPRRMHHPFQIHPPPPPGGQTCADFPQSVSQWEMVPILDVKAWSR